MFSSSGASVGVDSSVSSIIMLCRMAQVVKTFWAVSTLGYLMPYFKMSHRFFMMPKQHSTSFLVLSRFLDQRPSFVALDSCL